MDIDPKKEKAVSILNLTVFSVFAVLDIVNIFTAENGEYLRSKTMIISQGYQFVMFATIFILSVTNKKLNVREKTVFCLYCLLPLVAIIIQNVFKGYAIGYLSIIVSIEVLFLFLSVQKKSTLPKRKKRTKNSSPILSTEKAPPSTSTNSTPFCGKRIKNLISAI